MATMMPSDIEEFETEGEKAFYKFLEGVAKPDAHYLCWYLPEINGNEPDFLPQLSEKSGYFFKGLIIIRILNERTTISLERINQIGTIVTFSEVKLGYPR